MGGFFEGSFFSFEFSSEVSEGLLSVSEESFLFEDSVFSSVDFTENDVDFSGESSVVFFSFSDFLFVVSD